MPDADERRLVGRVGGAVRIGDRVHRPTGPWTPAVHALLDHAGSRVPHVPRVHGIDDQGREVLDYLPGHVLDATTERLTTGQLVSLVGWTRAFHRAVADFDHRGPWRFFEVPEPTLVAHNDLGYYNLCFDGDDLVGVFDWDLAGPSTPLLELAFIAWNGVPLWEDVGPGRAAARLRLIVDTYGAHPARELLHAVPGRIRLMVDGITARAAAGDEGMANLVALGAPSDAAHALAALVDRIPAIDRALG